MAGPYDSVVNIGGQSFVDGLWRIFGPALEGLTNPLPIALPGFTNAQLRITQLIPILPATGPLEVLATIGVTAEALLHLVNPATAPLTPLNAPRIVPVAVNLTPNNPISVRAALQLAAFGPAPATRFSIAFIAINVVTAPVAGIDPNLAALTTTKLQQDVTKIAAQLGLPQNLQPTFDQATVSNMLAELPDVIRAGVDDALTRLVAETGRLIFPIAGSGSSCDQIVLPTDADVSLSPSANGSYVLQIGFKRPGSTDIQTVSAFAPSGGTDCRVILGNAYLLRLLCCLVEKLSAFGLPFPAEHGTTDIKGNEHVACCTFRHVNATFGPIVIGGGDDDGISICIDGAPGEAKDIRLIGHFTQFVPTMIPLMSKILDITVDVAVPLSFDLDDAAALANLRPAGVAVYSELSVSPSLEFTVVILIVAAIISLGSGLVGAIAAAIIGPVVALIVLLLVWFACDLLTSLLGHAAGNLLRGAPLLKSPVAVPPGLFEAFGRLAPVSVAIDDLTAESVLHTPTSPWALLPRLGLPSRSPRGKGDTTPTKEPIKKRRRRTKAKS